MPARGICWGIQGHEMGSWPQGRANFKRLNQSIWVREFVDSRTATTGKNSTSQKPSYHFIFSVITGNIPAQSSDHDHRQDACKTQQHS